MSIPIVVMTDGRWDCLAASLSSLDRLRGDVGPVVIHDDSGDADYQSRIRATFPDASLVCGPTRLGFSGAYRRARERVSRMWPAEFHFWTEDDFVFTRDIDVDAMTRILARRPHLIQMALRRQPWNETERAAGGIVEMDPAAYTEWSHDGQFWLEHRKWFTTNPSLVPGWLTADEPWPTGEHSEGRFSIDLFARRPDLAAAYWGARDSGEWCEHVGRERVGTGY